MMIVGGGYFDSDLKQKRGSERILGSAHRGPTIPTTAPALPYGTQCDTGKDFKYGLVAATEVE